MTLKKIKLALYSDSDSDEYEEASSESQSSCTLKKQTALNSRLVDFIVLNNLPFSVVDTIEFEKLMKEAIPTYSVPCRQTVSNNLLPEKGNLVKEKLELSKIEFCSLTCDILNSNSNMSYLGDTVHFLNESFILTSRLLCLKYLEFSYTSDNMILKYNNKRVFKIVCDSGSNMKSAVECINLYIPCCAHKFNLCANDILKIKNIETKIVNKDNNFTKDLSIKDFDENGLLKNTIIDQETREKVEEKKLYELRLNLRTPSQKLKNLLVPLSIVTI
ncbi:unnamed protein product [Brachionus calyciflorus]|uniref:Uncharacterized protein n=1 Tax=Brachionus calyciflorus TaxID=104777 RepID=A0A814N824_9BILA|nr:unnamed protein product [Brachionus calyciflorus]